MLTASFLLPVQYTAEKRTLLDFTCGYMKPTRFSFTFRQNRAPNASHSAKFSDDYKSKSPSAALFTISAYSFFTFSGSVIRIFPP